MSRDKRSSDNWALLAAQKYAFKYQVPLLVCFQYIGDFKQSNLRQYSFLFEGLKETSEILRSKNISFFLLKGDAKIVIPQFIQEYKVGGLITDYNPLKVFKKRVKVVNEKISIPFFQVDAHNIIPVWELSDKKEYAAYTIRPKIKKIIDKYLVNIPELIRHPIDSDSKTNINWKIALSELKIDRSVKKVDWIVPGEDSARQRLEILKKSLKGYSVLRNDPTKNNLSNLSPYFHYGQLSTQRVAFEIKNSNLPVEDKDSFLEEMIVRRELSDNFCEYEPNYDQFDGFHAWAQKTLNEHRNDEREYLYPYEQFEEATTHDSLWNAAQMEMKVNGKMHGYMRMYWAKKILEWTPSPEIAQQIAINLNDKYQLDGRDPNGYVGVAWSIGGVHDRAWFERPVFGKVRYMNYNGCKRKFNVLEYVNKFII